MSNHQKILQSQRLTSIAAQMFLNADANFRKLIDNAVSVAQNEVKLFLLADNYFPAGVMQTHEGSEYYYHFNLNAENAEIVKNIYIKQCQDFKNKALDFFKECNPQESLFTDFREIWDFYKELLK